MSHPTSDDFQLLYTQWSSSKTINHNAAYFYDRLKACGFINPSDAIKNEVRRNEFWEYTNYVTSLKITELERRTLIESARESRENAQLNHEFIHRCKAALLAKWFANLTEEQFTEALQTIFKQEADVSSNV